jgi:sec-independent protein translocase protein TatA
MKLGMPELLVVLAIVVIIFGATRLPQLGKGLGEGIRNFRKGMKSDEEPAEPARASRSSGARQLAVRATRSPGAFP